MRNLIYTVVVAGMCGTSIHAVAANHTVSLGYAQINVKNFKNLKGVNAQYRYENQSPWGAVVSTTYASAKEGIHINDDNEYFNSENKVKYFSILAGPSYRFNEYLSLYTLAGLAQGKENYNSQRMVNTTQYSKFGTNKKTTFAYAIGVAINPVKNIAVNIGYEGTRFKTEGESIKFNGFNIGLGYKF
ncbi:MULTISPECIES: Ail/Lom family outer membrane beta-barrel protein [unclassified Acinetobacter]|uniref:Ail/Lom family outer membrane beta-barrel protein n=1 Tax=unclassified Acinetobacter TaxID=196816 RepID=UPI0029344846|nr:MULTISPECIES: Ail/Lom family outer membrane beta-barrel protein [unclassified Acinetobacter]WOE32903.1 Ail/Lom family outer membrane beta-barrel protein [Acinetobacter sp. SAAs470]WOE38380.1 Ail/Lom family outer membrane beta-barrel protein [Acinetobacter sp. SAAs474]